VTKKTPNNKKRAYCFSSSVWVGICAEEVSGPIFIQSTATAVTWNCHNVYCKWRLNNTIT